MFDPHYQPDLSTFPDGIVPQVKNVRSLTLLGVEINLRRVARTLKNVEYDPRKCNCCILRMRRPQCTMLLYRTGKLVSVESKSEYEALLGTRKVVRKIQKIGIRAKICRFQIQSITATVNIGFRVNSLGAFAQQYEEEGVDYDPGYFAGAVCRQDNATMQIFSSGMITFLHCQNRQQVYTLFRMLYRRLLGHRRPPDDIVPPCLLMPHRPTVPSFFEASSCRTLFQNKSIHAALYKIQNLSRPNVQTANPLPKCSGR